MLNWLKKYLFRISASPIQVGNVEQSGNYQLIQIKQPDESLTHKNSGDTYLDSGNWNRAVESYRQAVAINPSYAEAHSNLGFALMQQSAYDDAKYHLQQAVLFKPQLFNTHYILGMLSHQLGDVNDAIDNFNKAIAVKPNFPEAHNYVGNLLMELGRRSEALASYRKVVELNPELAEAHYNIALILQEQGSQPEAIKAFEHAVALDPNDAKLQNGLGCALHRSGKSEDALEHLRCALHLGPPSAEIHFNLGVVLESLGRGDDAAKSYSAAASLDPGHAEAGNNWGVILNAQGRLDEAIACFRRTLDRRPEYIQAWNNLGVSLIANRRVDEAASCLLRAINLNPQYFTAHSNLALARREQGKLEESMAASKSALAIHDSLSESIRLATLLPVVARSAEEIRTWRNHFDMKVSELLTQGGTVDDPLREVGACNFNLAYQPECDRELQEKAAQLYSAVCPTLLYTAPHCRHQPKPENRKLKVGFISKFMHNHSIGRTTRGLLANVARDRFHVTALFVPPFVDDFISSFIRDSADNYLVLPSTLEAARDKIAELGLDILFYQDIGMDAYTYFLAFSRLAPVQCVSFGHPDTTGIPNMDYWISSENFEPEGASAHYSEQLFLLHNLGTLAYYYRPTLEQPEKTRNDFGLPQDLHLYLCPQSLFKVHPDFDTILADILRGDPQGELVLIEARSAAWGDILRERFRETIPDVADRIRFLPGMNPNDFLALIAVCDVMLDTIYFNGMNTSLEALAVGVPVVTMPTSLQRGRHTSGMYKRMEMDECIAQTPEQYINISLRLGTDKNFRDSMKAKILSRSAVLYEDMEVVREFERFFVEAHALACRG